MKYLLLIFLLIGCSKKSYIQNNISQFSHDCKELAKCLEKPFELEFDINSETQPMICVIKYSDVTHANITPVYGTNIEEERPAFGYLQSALTVCKMFQKKDGYSILEQNRQYRYAKYWSEIK